MTALYCLAGLVLYALVGMAVAYMFIRLNWVDEDTFVYVCVWLWPIALILVLFTLPGGILLWFQEGKPKAGHDYGLGGSE